MFSTTKKLTALFSALSLAVAIAVASSPMVASADDGGTQGQIYADKADENNGGWDNTTTGLDGRPYVTSLVIDGVEQLSDTPTSPTDDFWTGRIRVGVYAFNACPTNKTPDSGQCYADPNRIGINVGFGDNYQLGTNFASPNATSYGVTGDSKIDMTIQMNAFKDSLGWTWLNGHPSFWAVDQEAGTVHVKFSPTFMPSSANIDHQCTTIPVSTCSTQQAESELLNMAMVLSVDKTNEVFRNSLFATAGAIMGSLEVGAPIDPNTPDKSQLTYGLAAPHLFADDYSPADGVDPGSPRRGALYGLVSNSLLTSGFGLEDPTQASTLMNVARVSDAAVAGSDVVAWSTWTAAENGTDGQLVSITDISFSSPKFAVKLKPKSTPVGTVSTFKKGMKKTQTQILKDLKLKLAKGEKVKLYIAKASSKYCAVSGTAIKALKAGKCSFTASVLTSKGKKVAGKTKSGKYTIG